MYDGPGAARNGRRTAGTPTARPPRHLPIPVGAWWECGLAREPDEARVQAEIRALTDPFLDELIQRYGREPVRQAVEAALAQPPGRPKGWAIDDWAALENMYRLLHSGQASDRTDAARQSLHLTESHSTESVIRRLRDKYREHEEEIAARVMMSRAVQSFYEIFPDLTRARRAFLEPLEKMQQALASITEEREKVLKAAHQAMLGSLIFPTGKN